jgi:DNA-binding YbaB/EbfC family protein
VRRFERLLITRNDAEIFCYNRTSEDARAYTALRKDDMGGFNLQELMSQAKRQYEVLQKKLEETVVEGSSGGGSVMVKMDGRKQVLSMKIDPEAVKSGDVEMLQDLVTAAINGASRKVDEAMQSSMGGMLGGLGIPGL